MQIPMAANGVQCVGHLGPYKRKKLTRHVPLLVEHEQNMHNAGNNNSKQPTEATLQADATTTGGKSTKCTVSSCFGSNGNQRFLVLDYH